MDERMVGVATRWTDGEMDGLMPGRFIAWVQCLDGWMAGWMIGWMVCWIESGTFGCRASWMVGLMEKCIAGMMKC